jgi:hypothetical protein
MLVVAVEALVILERLPLEVVVQAVAEQEAHLVVEQALQEQLILVAAVAAVLHLMVVELVRLVLAAQAL